jgi:Cytochrome P460
LYEGTEPHGMLLTTYLNQAALEALNDKAGSVPDGAIIVRENYMPDGTYDAMTVMYKVQGYNPDHNDWFFTKIGADGTVQAEGQVEGCQACHSARRDNDYIMMPAHKLTGAPHPEETSSDTRPCRMAYRAALVLSRKPVLARIAEM